jgi:ubiquinone biosynthesis protein UbiJ
MTVYPVSTPMTSTGWPGMMEPIWQMLPAREPHLPGYQRTDLGLSDRMFISAVVNLPPDQRPWGSITWIADVFNTSRPTVYAIGERTQRACYGRVGMPAKAERQTSAESQVDHNPTVPVTPNRIKRTILSLILPGGVSGRNIGDCLEAALDVSRSNATVSQLLHEAGRKAGEILETVDHRPMGEVVLARDEIFTGRDPNLLLVEPRTLVITGLYAAQDRGAETWACALMLTQDRKVQITGLAEDGCLPYAASCRLAGLDAAIQRDTWHPQYDVSRVIGDLCREAHKSEKAAAKLEKQLSTRNWTDAVFDEWISLVEHSEDIRCQIEQLRFWQDCLRDACEIVDLRSGEIRDRDINRWLLDETLQGLRQLTHPRIRKLTKKLAAQAPDLLTFLTGLPQPLQDWQARTAQHFPDPNWATFFQATVARLWRLEHALRSGHHQFQAALNQIHQQVAELVADDPSAHALAQDLLNILERVVRTSSAAEAINSILRTYFNGRRESTDQTSRQLFLNLFALWFNMHKFDRGPRKNKSPYQLAGIDLGTEDWLTLLGYPPD